MIKKLLRSKIALLPIFVLLVISKIAGQDSPNDSPYSCVYNHLFYLQEDNYQPAVAAASFLTPTDSTERQKLALQLKQIYDGQGLYIRMENIPTDVMYFDSLRNEYSYFPFAQALPEVYLTKTAEGWFYSNETSSRIPKIHATLYPFGSDFLINLLPKKSNSKFLGLFIWQYLGLGLLFLLSILIFLFARFLFRIFHKTILEKNKKVWVHIRMLAALWLAIKVFKIFLPILLLPAKLMEYSSIALSIFSSIVILVILLKLAHVLLSYLDAVVKRTESKMDEQLLPLLKRSVQFVIVAFWILHFLSLLGVNITTLVAGISIGGLAIALAAQDTLKNLFGSLTIFLDKPFQIGDWIKSGEVEGTVEEVGFRSTRIRSFANSLIYVPNSKISDSVVDNFGLREYRRYKTTIGITYNTPPATIEAFVKGLRKLVVEQKHTKKDGFEIHFTNLGPSALEILFYIFFEAENWTQELECKQELLLSILKLAEELDVQFAYPSTSVYLEGDLPFGPKA